MVEEWRTKINKEDAAQLDEIIRQTSRHRHAYETAAEPSIAQLWLAILELKKKQVALDSLLLRLEKVISYLEKIEKAEVARSNPIIEGHKQW